MKLPAWTTPIIGTALLLLIGGLTSLVSHRIEATEKATAELRSAIDGAAQSGDAYREQVGELKISVAEVRASMATRADLERSRDKVRVDIDKLGAALAEQLREIRGDIRRRRR